MIYLWQGIGAAPLFLDESGSSRFNPGGSALALQWALLIEAQKPKCWVLAVPNILQENFRALVGVLHRDHCGRVCEGEDVKQEVPLHCHFVVLFIPCVSPSPLSAHASHNESHTPVGTNHPQSVTCSGSLSHWHVMMGVTPVGLMLPWDSPERCQVRVLFRLSHLLFCTTYPNTMI